MDAPVELSGGTEMRPAASSATAQESKWPSVRFTQGPKHETDLTEIDASINEHTIKIMRESGVRIHPQLMGDSAASRLRAITESIPRIAHYVCSPERTAIEWRGRIAVFDSLNYSVEKPLVSDFAWKTRAFSLLHDDLMKVDADDDTNVIVDAMGIRGRTVRSRQIAQFGDAGTGARDVVRLGAYKARYRNGVTKGTSRIIRAVAEFTDMIDKCRQSDKPGLFSQSKNVYEWFRMLYSYPKIICDIPYVFENVASYDYRFISDNLVYTPPMLDVGCEISVMHEQISTMVQSIIRTSVPVQSVLYTDVATKLAEGFSKGRNSSAFSKISTQINNARATAALPQILAAWCHSGTKINVEVPLEASTSCVYATLALMSVTSKPYDAMTVVAIHNAYVGVVMKMMERKSSAHSLIDFSRISYLNNNLTCMAVPRFDRKLQPKYRALMRYLHFFHGTRMSRPTLDGCSRVFLNANFMHAEATYPMGVGRPTDVLDNTSLYYSNFGTLPGGKTLLPSCMRSAFEQQGGYTEPYMHAERFLASSFEVMPHNCRWTDSKKFATATSQHEGYSVPVRPAPVPVGDVYVPVDYDGSEFGRVEAAKWAAFRAGVSGFGTNEPDKKVFAFMGDGEWVHPMFSELFSTRSHSLLHFFDRIAYSFAPIDIVPIATPVRLTVEEGANGWFDQDVAAVEGANYSICKLAWTDIASVMSLCVPPPEVDIMAHVPGLVRESVSFNSDMCVNHNAMSLFMMAYRDTRSPMMRATKSVRIKEYLRIVNDLRRHVPVSSWLTAVHEGMISPADGIGDFWRDSVYIDDRNTQNIYNSTTAFAGPCTDRNPTARYKVLRQQQSPYSNPGYILRDFTECFIGFVINIADKYVNSKCSSLDQATGVIVNPPYCSTTDKFRTRRQFGATETLPVIRDAINVPVEYTQAPYVEGDFIYSNESLPDCRMGEFDMSAAYKGYTSQHDTAISMVESTALIARAGATDLIRGRYALRVATPMPIVWDSTTQFKLVPVEDGVAYAPPIGVTLHKPSEYVKQWSEAVGMFSVPPTHLPILPVNVGPFITRFALRDPDWPANADYTVPGAFTENVIHHDEDNTSLCYNRQALAVIAACIHPINIIDPATFVKYHIDAKYSRVSI